MITFLPAIPEYDKDEASQTVWGWINERYGEVEGFGYYKYPVVRSSGGSIPELTFISRSYEPVTIRCLSFTLDEIESFSEEMWSVQGKNIDSPVLELEDFVIGLQSNFDRERQLRKKFNPKAVLALPLIRKSEFEGKFGQIVNADMNVIFLWSKDDLENVIIPLKEPLTDIEWRLTRAVIQGVRPMSSPMIKMATQATQIGDAVRELEKQIALFDFEQEKAAIPIAPGPQRLRGLAGTGKTVLLAMKAANIHKHFPEKRILFTFNTQSLYNQARNLITKFYRYHTEIDPDWDKVQIMHAWGGQNRAGVYFELSARQGVTPMNLRGARTTNPKYPFQACCQKALSLPIEPYYDFILVDEAQDFPKEYFQILYRLAKDPHCVYWAYDELQSLQSLEIPKPEELFGNDSLGNPLVSLEGEDYPGGIEKDVILYQSYRCPHQVLMLAHAIGLGLYNKQGCVQMLQNEDSWKAIGYEIKEGTLKKGSKVTIYRPPENSPNRITDIYKGTQNLISVNIFPTRKDELEWIANSIQRDINQESLRPEQIIVISLDALEAKNYMSSLQLMLRTIGIDSIVPGVIDDSATFAEPGKVTLSSVYRVKGNEAPVTYIVSFESLYDYLAPVEGRNKAFTSISRSKAFVRITGVGKEMEVAKVEIDRIIKDYPYFKFVFPDMAAIRNLDAETGKRRRAVAKAKDSLSDLIKVDPQALSALAKSDPELFKRLAEVLKGVKGENL